MSHTDRPCTWCAAPIAIERRPGRPRLYCAPACRQRAYEHRHGMRHRRTVRPLPGQHPRDRWSGTGYELGATIGPWGKRHALRVAVRPEGQRRETLCGVLARPVPGHYFTGVRDRECVVCAGVVGANPLSLGVSPSNELSRLRAVITEGVEQRLDPLQMLAWLGEQAAGAAPSRRR